VRCLEIQTVDDLSTRSIKGNTDIFVSARRVGVIVITAVDPQRLGNRLAVASRLYLA
jgi:hypothetical protein